MPFLAKAYAGWLSLPFPDFGVPANMKQREQWEGVANTIRDLLKKGTDVLVACHGGHGRSGLFCAIVGYLLNIEHDNSWSSPVEKVRFLHCEDAVETFAQEKFVYDVLGLRIKIVHAYDIQDDPWGTWAGRSGKKYEKCPLCGTSSMFIGDYGMCLGCQTKYEKGAPVRKDLTLKDISKEGQVTHVCTSEKCVGIWKASICGHVVHDMIIYDGYCTTCFDKMEAEGKYAESKIDEIEPLSACPICGISSMHAQTYGICYDCAEQLVTTGMVDMVHNSITDPYRAIAHTCNDVSCVGVVCADTCGHVVHNQEIEDGMCITCRVQTGKYQNRTVQ